MESVASEVKPCPFCGNSNAYLYRDTYMAFHQEWAWVCGNCGAVGPRACDTNHAIAMWNGRKEPPLDSDYACTGA